MTPWEIALSQLAVPSPKKTKLCSYCHKPFVLTRANRYYCSVKCNKLKQRALGKQKSGTL